MPVPGQMWPPPGQARRPPCGVCAHGTYDHRRALHVGLGMQPRGLFFIPPLPQGGLRRGYGHDCRTPATRDGVGPTIGRRFSIETHGAGLVARSA
jgi:hypothetical protein